MKHRKINILLLSLLLILGLKTYEVQKSDKKSNKDIINMEDALSIMPNNYHYLIIYEDEKNFNKKKLEKIKNLIIKNTYEAENKFYVSVVTIDDTTNTHFKEEKEKEMKKLNGVIEILPNYATLQTVIFKENVSKENKIKIFKKYVANYKGRSKDNESRISEHDKKFVLILNHYAITNLKKEKEIKDIIGNENADRNKVYKNGFVIEN